MNRYDITAFGAVADGNTVNTRAIQAAIDACVQGGMVYIPKGIFASGAVFLKSDMTLYLEEGAMLLGSGDIKDYPLYKYRFEGREQLCHASLINTVDIRDYNLYNGYISPEDRHYERLKNITIEGAGTIDANGTLLRRLELDAGIGIRGRAVVLRNVDNVTIKGVTICHSPAWCLHTIYCNNILLENVHIRTKFAADGSPYDVHNGDGFDPDSCRNVTVKNCLIESQDDCIAIKSGRDEEGRSVGIPTENVTIKDCTFKYGFGVAVGSEMSGSVRRVLVKDCTFENTYSFGSVKAPRGRGGVIENITYENIRHTNMSLEHQDCKWFRGALYVDQFYSHDEFDLDKPEEFNEGTAAIRDITFKNIELETIAGNAIYLAGLPENYLKNISLINVKAKGKYGMTAYNIDGLKQSEVTVEATEGNAITIKNVTEA